MGGVAGRYQGERSLGTKRGRQSATATTNPVIARKAAYPTRKIMDENTYPKQLTSAQQALAIELGGLLLFSWRETELNFPALVLEAVFTATENGLQMDHGAFSGADSMEWELGEMEEDILAVANRLYKMMNRGWKVLVISIDPVTRFCGQTFFKEKSSRPT